MRKIFSGAAAVMLLALLSAVSAPSAAAQEKEDDAMVFWSTTTITKSLGKENRWTVGIMSEYRHVIHDGVSGMNQYFVRPSFSYKALPWLKLQYQMDFAHVASSGFNWRFIPEITFIHKAGDFSFTFRQRAMTTWKVEHGTNSTVLRSRGKVDYHIPKSPVTVHFAVEPYWCDFSRDSFDWFQKVRWYAGFNFKLTDNLTLTPQYVCQAYHNHKGLHDRRTYDDHVLYVTFTVKL